MNCRATFFKSRGLGKVKVGVCGAAGRMGREVCRAVSAESDLELVCAVDAVRAETALSELIPGLISDLRISAEPTALAENGAEVIVDFSIAEAARSNVSYALRKGINCIVGTTGLEEQDLKDWEELARKMAIACLVAPNFAIGAVLMMHFSREAARYMDGCEIIELHHQAKIDAPSGTSRLTADMISEAAGLPAGTIPIHSVRLPGLVAHQEVIFGSQGQSLTIRHDSFDRTSFMPGVILALRKVPAMKGLVVGLEKILDL
ncbi:MAG: hypothetical protein A2V52_00510 [Actinobacteria bacterium RBG_19FT_COMBO_54_7]|nr:MAG: hypothetical protein A2V52_00510 [Actinobacteria bacterium RBG_19FT_COMBO_54_7]